MEKLTAIMMVRRDFEITGIVIAKGKDGPLDLIKFSKEARVSNHEV